MNAVLERQFRGFALIVLIFIISPSILTAQQNVNGSNPSEDAATEKRRSSYLTIHRLMETALINLDVKGASLPELFNFFEERYAHFNPAAPPIRFLLPDPVPPKVLDLSLQAVPMLEALKIVADLSLMKFRVHGSIIIFRDVNDNAAFVEIYDLEDWKLEAKRLFPALQDERLPFFKAVVSEVASRKQSNPEFFDDPTWPLRISTIVAARHGMTPDIYHPSINVLEFTPDVNHNSDEPRKTMDSARDIAKRSLPSVFTVLVTGKFGEVISQGSAFLITPTHLITNAHVIDTGRDTEIYLLNSNFDEPILVVGIPGTDDDADLAVLEVEESLGTPLPLAPAEPEIGETVFAVGTPKGLEGTFSTGIVSGFRDHDGVQHLQISAPISPGSSGGPILNSLGEVIGVAVSTLKSGQNLNFAIRMTHILDFLESIIVE